MPQFSANLGFLWFELSLPERIVAARQAGFSAVECHWPYDHDAAIIKQTLLDNQLPMLCINTAPGDLQSAEFGLCALPGREADARAAIDQAVAYATAIGANNVHVMAGLSGDHPQAISTFIDNLRYASDQAGQFGIGILIEPINRLEQPEYALHSIEQALQVCARLEALIGKNHNIKIMFDCYHIGRAGFDVPQQLKRALPNIGHIQIASLPDRAEPDHGELDYPALYAVIDQLGYNGFIGAEYIPAGATAAGLGWFNRYH